MNTQVKKTFYKQWRVLVIAIVATGIAISQGGCDGGSSPNHDVVITNGAGKMRWVVPDVLAGDKKPTFERVTRDVYTAMNDHADMKSLDINMSVQCEDIYGKKMMRESTVKLSASDIAEMRKFTSSEALASDCMEWQMMFEAGYEMCGQLK